MAPDPITPPVAQATSPQPVARRRRWLRLFMPGMLLLVAVAVWFAPLVVAKTELRNRVAREALSDMRGHVEVGSASLGWLSPIELRDVTIKDQAGRTLATLPKITSAKSLLDLVRHRTEPGEFTLHEPVVAVVFENGTTNLETAFAEYLKDESPSAPTRTAVSLRVSNGTLSLTDTSHANATRIDGINASVNVPANRAEAVAVQLTAATGNLAADLSLGEHSSLKLTTIGFPIETLAPLFARIEPGLMLAGSLSSDLTATWSKDNMALAGTASVKQFALSAEWLDGDTLRLESAQLPLDVELAGSVVNVRKFDLDCDVGTISAAGTFDPNESIEALLARAGIVLRANVELAALGKQLPRLLHVREGTELREGKLDVTLNSSLEENGTVWDGKIHTTAIKAIRDGKPLHWDDPLQIEFRARHTSGRIPVFDKLICKSDFIALNAKTSPETVQAAANVYLNRLDERLADFIDLRGAKLDGEAFAELVGRREPNGEFRAEGSVELKNFAFTFAEGKGLKEKTLKLKVAATGSIPSEGPGTLATASLVLTAAGDQLHLTLLEPVTNIEALSNGMLDVRLSGDVARWKSRVGTLIRIPAYQMSGQISASGKAKLAADQITVDGLTIDLKKVKFRGAGLIIDEPAMKGVGDLTFTRATSVAVFDNLTVTSDPLTVSGGKLTFEFPSGGELIVSGNGQCVADLNRLGAVVKLYTDVRGPDAMHGRGTGPIGFRYAGDVTTFQGTLDVVDFFYGPKENAVWAEPRLRLEADGSYTDSTDTVALKQAKVERPGFTLDASGSVGKVTTTQDVNFTGKLSYDWEKLTPLLREFVGGNFTAQGTGTRAVAVNGQLSPPGSPANASMFAAMNADAAVGWQAIRAYGLDVGSAEAKATMTRGVIAVAPISTTISGGKLTLAPTLNLNSSPGVMTLAKGTIVDRAKLSPQSTSGGLGYALPAIANATQAEGEISVVLDDNRIPFGDMNTATVKGTVVIHKAVVGAGPVVSEIAKLLGAKNTTMTLVDDEAVPVQIVNGRVHHQNLSVRISGTTIRTSGSVGFDNSLDLIVDVPLPKDLPMLKNNPLLLKAVAGKVVKVPVKGTLTRPTLDPRAFDQAVAQLAREGAKDVGQDLLEKELQKLFPNLPSPGILPKGKLPIPLPFGKKQ